LMLSRRPLREPDEPGPDFAMSEDLLPALAPELEPQPA
jgi:hypothetical protein